MDLRQKSLSFEHHSPLPVTDHQPWRFARGDAPGRMACPITRKCLVNHVGKRSAFDVLSNAPNVIF